MLSSPLRFTRLSDARSGPWRRFVIALDPAMLGPPQLEDLSRGTEGLQTPRWRKVDSNHRFRVMRTSFEARSYRFIRASEKAGVKTIDSTRRPGGFAGPMVRIRVAPAASLVRT
jgi:hypothetical protein